MEGVEWMKLSQLDTEQINSNSLHIDEMTTEEILTVINQEDQKVAIAVKDVIPQIAKAVDCIYEKMCMGGRLIYMGAGTSGRLGVLGASECPPTYGVDPTLVQGLIAGGKEAFTTAIEGAEDSKEIAVDDLKKIELSPLDVVCGIAASGRTPYVVGALAYARKLGCSTISICCVKNGAISQHAHFPIEAVVGPEVITGSTRMKAGTAQKLILNMLSTSVMIKKGKVYKNLMVDVQPTNEKLRIRAINIVQQAISVDEGTAKELLIEADNNVKIAILKGLTNMSKEECLKALKDSDENISQTIRTITKGE